MVGSRPVIVAAIETIQREAHLKAQKISTNLWFDNQAEETARFYCSVFENSKIGRITYYHKEGSEYHGQKPGTVMTVEFNLNGQRFVGLNGRTHFQFNEAVSFIVNCESQEEVDNYWEKLGAGGDPTAQQCGWLKDRCGVSWQIVPTALTEMVNDPDQEKDQRMLMDMCPMKKLDIAALEVAFEVESG